MAKNEENKDENKTEKLKEYGQVTLSHKIHLITIIGEVEGHECLPANTKTTKYEHILPQLAAIEDSREMEGVLILLNTVGGDVEAGLAIAEMIASLSKPTVSLVLGGSHSIGVPLAVCGKATFIVPSASMTIHPVRMSGQVIAAPATYRYFERIQERIIDFVARNSRISAEKFRELMLSVGDMANDVGSVIYGQEAVALGIIDRIGSLSDALEALYKMVEKGREG